MASSSSSSSQLSRTTDSGSRFVTLACALANPSSAQPSPFLHLPGFNTLPTELHLIIIQLACLAPPSSSFATNGGLASRNGSRFPRLDIPTTLSLLTVSGTFYDLVVPVLYEHVTLARPSTLASFLQVLSARPQLCKYIASLHVGNLDQLPLLWRPIFKHDCVVQLNLSQATVAGENYNSSELYIRSSLRSAEEVSLMPSWCEPAQAWPVVALAGPNPRSTAIRQALEVAERCIDVNLTARECKYNRVDPDLRDAEYRVRIHEVQAVFDLYLLEMGRLERVHSRTYPTLRIEGYAGAPHLDRMDATDSEDLFVVTRSDIAQHLSRARSITDRFDSPLLFARSGIDRKDGVFAPPSYIRAEFNAIVSAIPFDSSLPAAATLWTCLDLLRQLLKSTPNITHLSVSSFLDWAVWDTPGALHLPTLRYLSIESPHYQWDQLWLTPQFLTNFAHLEEVRVCTMHISTFYSEYFATRLPVLKVLEMCLPQTIKVHNVWRLKRTLSRLAQHEVKATQPSAQVNEDEAAGATIANSEHSDDVSTPRPPLTIVVRLHPLDIRRIVQGPSIELRDPWASGVFLPSQVLRLLLWLEWRRGLIGAPQ